MEAIWSTRAVTAGALSSSDETAVPTKIENVEMEAVHCSADGKAGGSTKVLRRFPIVRQWSGEVRFLVADETIDESTFHTHLLTAGTLIGIGRWRPINNGKYGKFMIEKFKWEKVELPV